MAPFRESLRAQSVAHPKSLDFRRSGEPPRPRHRGSPQ
jgi:hypothetical protein